VGGCGSPVQCGAGSSSRLLRLLQHRHERNAADGRQTARLPPDVLQVLEADAPEAHGHLPTAAGTRTQARRERAPLLIAPGPGYPELAG